MLTISDIASRLNQIGEEINTKDTLILMMNDVISIVNKLIYEPSLVCTSIYPELKNKYISQLEHKIGKIKNITNNNIVAPIYIPRSPKNTNLSETAPATATATATAPSPVKPKRKRPQIVTSEVNTPLEVDIYKNPKYKPKIVKSIKINLHTEPQLPEHFFKYDNDKYYIDFKTNKVFDENNNKIGYLSADNLYINDKIIKLKSINESEFNGNSINDMYGCMDVWMYLSKFN